MAHRSSLRSSARRLGLTVAAGYLTGTLPSADIVTRIATGGKMNIRHEGTGNPGAANVAGVLGKKWGAAVMAADVGKGVLATRVGLKLGGTPGMHVSGPLAVAGHCYPVWDKFDGGKGVATSSGQVIGTFPVYFPIDAAVSGIVSHIPGIKRGAFVGTQAASAAWILCSVAWWRKQWPNLWGPPATIGLPLASLATSVIIRIRFEQTEAKVAAWRAREHEAELVGSP